MNYINVGVENDQNHIDKEVPGKGDEDWVVVDWNLATLVLSLSTASKHPKCGHPLALSSEEPADYVHHNYVHWHCHYYVLHAPVKEAKEAILPKRLKA